MKMTMLRGQSTPHTPTQADEHAVHLVPESDEVRAARIIASLRDNPADNDREEHLTRPDHSESAIVSSAEPRRATG